MWAALCLCVKHRHRNKYRYTILYLYIQQNYLTDYQHIKLMYYLGKGIEMMLSLLVLVIGLLVFLI